MHQTSNIWESSLGADWDGTKLIFPWNAMADAFVQADIRSDDNDRAGLITRYQDATHYYQLTLDEQNQKLRLSKRKGSSYISLGVQSLSGFDWSVGHQVELLNLVCSFYWNIDNTVYGSAYDIDCDYMDGYAGMISAGMGNTYVNFDNFKITYY